MQRGCLAFRFLADPPPFVERVHVTRIHRLARLDIDQIVLLAQPLTQCLAALGPDGRLFQIPCKVRGTPRARIQARQGRHEIRRVPSVAVAGGVGVPRGLFF